ncbi:Rho GTPase activation protein [Parasitella parasitica]|nr:Rho GTPase activation protein [Parasitella parasitica]
MQSPPLFGSTLVTALARSSFTTPSGLSIPGILGRCFHEIEEKGLDIEGIFRKSGSAAAVNQLQAQFEENHNPFLIKLPSTLSTHSLAALFKRYLQQLPEPVIPRSYQPLFISIFDEQKCTQETLKRKLKEICKTLPHEHLHLLQFLLEVAHSIQQHQDKNQMSVESLAIIFAPTCVRIDAVSQLLPDPKQNRSASYSLNSSNRPCSSSYTSLPLMLNKQQFFRKARELLLSTVVRKKQRQQGKRNKLVYGSLSTTKLLYKPNELLQLELVKESNTWIRIFEFMMSYPEVFTTLTNPLKSQKYVRPVLAKNTSANTAPTNINDIKKAPAVASHSKQHKIDPLSLWTSPFTQQEKKMLIDFSTLEFTESYDLIKTFEHFDLKLDHHRVANDKDRQQSQPLLMSSSSATKYVKTLQSWKTREEENPTIVIPQEVIIANKRKTLSSRNNSQPSSPANSRDWPKFNPTVIESNERNSARQPIF